LRLWIEAVEDGQRDYPCSWDWSPAGSAVFVADSGNPRDCPLWNPDLHQQVLCEPHRPRLSGRHPSWSYAGVPTIVNWLAAR
jgi:hypothetical protein